LSRSGSQGVSRTPRRHGPVSRPRGPDGTGGRTISCQKQRAAHCLDGTRALARGVVGSRFDGGDTTGASSTLYLAPRRSPAGALDAPLAPPFCAPAAAGVYGATSYRPPNGRRASPQLTLGAGCITRGRPTAGLDSPFSTGVSTALGIAEWSQVHLGGGIDASSCPMVKWPRRGVLRRLAA